MRVGVTGRERRDDGRYAHALALVATRPGRRLVWAERLRGLPPRVVAAAVLPSQLQ